MMMQLTAASFKIPKWIAITVALAVLAGGVGSYVTYRQMNYLPVIKPFGEFSVHLPGKYKLFSTSRQTVVIIAPYRFREERTNVHQSVSVAARVTRFRVVNDYLLVGLVEPSPMSELTDIERPGYFVVDTRTGIVRGGLSYEEFVSLLSSYGVHRSVRLLRV